MYWALTVYPCPTAGLVFLEARSYRSNDGAGGILVVILILGGIFVYVWLREKYLELRRQSEQCQHGVRGGLTCLNCTVCRHDQEEQQRVKRAEFEAQQKQRARQRAADELRQEEIKRLAQAHLARLDFLLRGSPYQFEDAVASMFTKLGYVATQTPYSNDGGKDIIAVKDAQKMLVECKRFDPTNPVGRPDLQKFYAAIMEERANGGFFVTTSYFSHAAMEYEFVRTGLIKLVNGETLTDMMLQAYPESRGPMTYRAMCLECGCSVIFDLGSNQGQANCANGHVVTSDVRADQIGLREASGKPYCRTCGKPMRLVHGYRGPFLGCTGYPLCRFTQPAPPGY